jgi:hypothetical protein
MSFASVSSVIVFPPDVDFNWPENRPFHHWASL